MKQSITPLRVEGAETVLAAGDGSAPGSSKGTGEADHSQAVRPEARGGGCRGGGDDTAEKEL